jgi:AcrR family transcriptional regulator
MIEPNVNPGSTKARLLAAAETLFIEHGYEAMSLRQITAMAGANLAAVNYHFGSKDVLVQELLTKRLDRLNQERLQLLSTCEAQYGEQAMDVSVVLSVLFAPALRLTRDSAGGPAFMRLLGRVYSDTSPFIRDFLHEHYRSIYERFFAAFARALPHMPRNELGVRLQFSLKALSGVLASENMDEMVVAICIGETVSDSLMLARLIAFVTPMLTTPFGQTEQTLAVERVMKLADSAAESVDEDEKAQAQKASASPSPWSTSAAGI